MSRLERPYVRPRWSFPASCIMLLIVFAPPPSARAGIGNPIKKVKKEIEKVEPKPEATPSTPGQTDEPLVFEDVTVELTEARVGHILATFQKAHALSAPRPGLIEKHNKVEEEQRAIWDKRGDAIRKARSQREEVKGCYQLGYQEAAQQKAEEYARKVMAGDQAVLQKFSAAAQKDNAAAAQGDSAAIQRINATLYSETLPSHEDSLKVRQSCGTIPPSMPEEDRIDTLDKEIGSLNEQIRQLDEKVAEAQAKQGGLTDQQWATALERIDLYIQGTKSSNSSSKIAHAFTDEELKALKKHVEELRAALGK